MDIQTKIKELQVKRDSHTSGFFWLGLYIAFIFGIPAGIAVVVGKKLNTVYSTNKWTTILLFVSFIISWVIVGFKYNQKSKVLNEIESQIKELRDIENKQKVVNSNSNLNIESNTGNTEEDLGNIDNKN